MSSPINESTFVNTGLHTAAAAAERGLHSSFITVRTDFFNAWIIGYSSNIVLYFPFEK